MPTNAIKKQLHLYFGVDGTLLDKQGDLSANAQDDETFVINAYIEDGVVDNQTTLINFTPQDKMSYTSDWFAMFYREMVSYVVPTESEPRVFAKFSITVPSIILLVKSGKEQFIQRITIIQRYGNTHLGNFETIMDLIAEYPPTVTLDQNNDVAFVYSNEVGQSNQVGFYQVEYVSLNYVWVKKESILYNLSTKQFNFLGLTVNVGFSNPRGVPTVAQSTIYQLMQELNSQAVRLQIVEDNLQIAQNDIANLQNQINKVVDGTTDIAFDNAGTDLNSTFVEEAIKEVNDKSNANEQNIADMKDGTDAFKVVSYDTTYSGEILIGQTKWNDTFKCLETRVSDNVVIQHGQEILQYVCSVSSIQNGQAVYFVGSTGQRMEVAVAGNTSQNQARGTIAIATENFTPSGELQWGFVCTYGLVNGIKTDYAGWVTGDTLWLSANGTLTNSRPNGTAYRVRVGVVGRVHSTDGSVFVAPQYYPTMGDLSQVDTATPQTGDIYVRQANGSFINSQRLVTAESEINNIKNGTTIVKKAEQDASGNVITTTYETKADATSKKAETDQRIDNIITTPVPTGEVISQEIIDARQGETSLGANITNVKSQLAQNLHQKTESNTDIIFDINLDTIFCKNAENPLNIPTYVTNDNMVVHPSVLYFSAKWNGYHYWMAMTPYTDTDSQYENPSIVASNDGESWVEPVGIVNPIALKPTEGYNADVHLIQDKDGKTVHCIWRESSSGYRVKVLSSTDGVNWTNLQVIIDKVPAYEADVATPSVIYENGKYYLFAIDLIQVRPTALQMYEATEIRGTWSYIKDVQIPNIPEGKQIWHTELRKVNGIYLLLYTIASVGTYGGDGMLYLAKSRDLVNWDTSPNPIVKSGGWDKTFYKSSFWVENTVDGISLKLWYGTNTTNGSIKEWYVGYTDVYFKRPSDDTDNAFFDKNLVNYKRKCVAFDDFDKADTTSGLGMDYLGNRWETLTNSNGQPGILNKQVYSPNGSAYGSMIDIGKSDFEYTVDMVNHLISGKIFFRVVNIWNGLRVYLTDTEIVFQRIESGSATLEQRASRNVGYNKLLRVKIVCLDNRVLVYLNNELKIDILEGNFKTFTTIGLQVDSATPMFKQVFATVKKSELIAPLTDYQEVINRYDLELVKAVNKLKPYLVGDTFSRPDSTSSLGNADSGQTWEAIGGTFGIIDGCAYLPVAGNSKAVIDVGKSDVTMSVLIDTVGTTNTWTVLRATDTNNYFRIGGATNLNYLSIQKVVSGAVTELYVGTLNVKSGDMLKIKAVGDKVSVYVNDILMTTVTDIFNQTATKHGLQTDNTTTRYRNFIISNA